MKILLLGKDGQVGWELQRSLAALGELTALGSREADLCDLAALRRRVEAARAELIVNAAAYTAVDKAEAEPAQARRVNAEAVGVLADVARDSGAWLVHYSTDYVFDGEQDEPYCEDDAVNPLSAYGRTKLEGEQAIRESGCRHLLFRTSWVFAARGQNFAKTMLRLAAERDQLRVIADQFGAPTSAELIADVSALCLYRLQCDPLLRERASGTYHLAAAGETSWHAYASRVIAAAHRSGLPLRCPTEAVQAIPASEYPLPARRPRSSRLSVAKLEATFGLRLPPWQTHVDRLVQELVGENGK